MEQTDRGENLEDNNEGITCRYNWVRVHTLFNYPRCTDRDNRS